MRSLLFALSVFAIVALVRCGRGGGGGPEWKACRKEAGLPEEGPLDHNDAKVKCLKACVMEKKGKMVNGKIDEAKFMEMAKKIKKDDATVQEKAKECVTQANASPDKCETANIAWKCMHEKLH